MALWTNEPYDVVDGRAVVGGGGGGSVNSGGETLAGLSRGLEVVGFWAGFGNEAVLP